MPCTSLAINPGGFEDLPQRSRRWAQQVTDRLNGLLRSGQISKSAIGEYSVAVALATSSGLEYSGGSLRIDLNTTILNLTPAGLGFANQSGNTFLASPSNGAAGPVSFRALTGDDLANSGVSAAVYGCAAAVGQVTVDVKGRVTGASNVTIAIPSAQVTDLPVLVSGTYTPTATALDNLDAASAEQAQYMRVGGAVTVSGRLFVDPTLAATATRLTLSLPVASNLGNVADLGGVAFSPTVAGQGAAVSGNVSTDTAQVEFVSGDTGNQPMSYTYTYRVI